MKNPFTQYKKNRLRSHVESLWLRLRNQFHHGSILTPDGPVLSLTTFGSRLNTVHIAIESIGRGIVKPSQCILWLDLEERGQRIPPSLNRLQSRGLQICYFERIGPHSKYYPTVATTPEFTQPLVTADDDVIYPRYWLRELVKAHKHAPNLIHCFRAHCVVVQNKALAPYHTWPPCQDTRPSLLNFATGVSGVIYPPGFLAVLKNQGEGFKAVCPKADDIWLHAQAVRSGFPIQQIQPEPVHFVEIPNTRQTALNQSNVRGGGNDVQIAQTYTAADLDRLCSVQ